MKLNSKVIRLGALGVLVAVGASAQAFDGKLVVSTSGLFNNGKTWVGGTAANPILSFTGESFTLDFLGSTGDNEFTLGNTSAGEPSLGVFTLANKPYSFTKENGSGPQTDFTLTLTYTDPTDASVDFYATVYGAVYGTSGKKPANVTVVFDNKITFGDEATPIDFVDGIYSGSFGIGVTSNVGFQFGAGSSATSASNDISGAGFYDYTAAPAPAGVLTFAVGLFARRRRKA